MKTSIQEIGETLWKDPSERNWKVLSSSLNKTGVVYYKAFFGKGKLKNTQDLRSSYVELYDKKREFLTKIPIFMKQKKGLRGATIYLKGLMVKNG